MDPDPARRPADRVQDLILVADLAVGDEDQHAITSGRELALGDPRLGRVGEQPARVHERLEHLGAALGLRPGELLDGAEPVAVRCPGQPRRDVRDPLDRIVEAQHREPVRVGERVHDPGGGAAGRDHLPPVHAAGPVQHQHDITRPRPTEAVWRHEREAERALRGPFTRIGGEDQRTCDLVVAGDRQPQDEVPIQPLARPEPDAGAAVRGRLLRGGVQTAPDARQRQPGRVDLRAQREPDRVGESGQQHRRADPGGVRDGVGVDGHPAAGRHAVERTARDVPRRDHQGEPERRLATLVRQRLREREADRDPLARGDVADSHREYVRPVLFGDRHLLSLRDRLVIVRPGLGTLLQHPLHDMPGGLHPHRGDRRPVRQREDVGRLQRDVERVTEALRHLHAGEQASNGGPHVDLFQWQVSPASCECTEAAVWLGGGVGLHRRDVSAHVPLPSWGLSSSVA